MGGILLTTSNVYADNIHPDKITDNIIVNVPTEISCYLNPDLTITTPNDLNITTNDNLVLDLSEANNNYNIDYNVKINNIEALNRQNNIITAPEAGVNINNNTYKLNISIPKLANNHKELINNVANSNIKIFNLMFKFNYKELHGSVTISGGTDIGSKLIANVSGVQDDAKLNYQWTADGTNIHNATNPTYTVTKNEAGKEIQCKIADSSSKYIGTITSNGINIPIAFAVFSTDDDSLNFYKRNSIPKVGERFEGKIVTEVYLNIETSDYGDGVNDDLEGGNKPNWIANARKIKSVKIVDKIKPISCAFWFINMEYVTSDNFDINMLDTSECRNMRSMFMNMLSLTRLDLSHFKTPKLTNMNNMFDDCLGITTLDVSSFNTSNVTDMRSVFNDCRSLTSIDISNFDASAATRVRGMFYSCMSLTRIDLPNLRTNGDILTDSSRMFEGCTKLEYLDIRGLNVRAQTDMSDIFKGCTSLATIVRGKEFYCNSYKAYMPSPDPAFIPGADGYWYDLDTGYAYLNRDVPSNKEATYVAVNPVKAPTVTIEGSAFYGNKLSAEVYGQPGETTATSYQWQGSTDGGKTWVNSVLPGNKTSLLNLTTVNAYTVIGNYYRCVVTTTAGLKRVPQGISVEIGPVEANSFAVYSTDDESLNFYKRAIIPKVGTQFDGKTVTEVYTGFESTEYTGNWPNSNCPWLSIAGKVKSVSVMDTIKPLSIAWWFNQFSNCTLFDLGNLDTSQCVSLKRLFSSCSNATDVRGLEKWDTSKIKNFAACFDGMRSLDEIPGISNWNTQSCQDFASVFYNCYNLKRVDISGWSDESCNAKAGSWQHMLFGSTSGGYPNLQYVKIGSNWRYVTDLLRDTNAGMGVTGADGKWYAASDGKGYAPADIPSNKADTYYASKNLLPKFNGVNLNLNENNIVDKNNNDNKIELGLNSKDSYIDIQQNVDNLDATVNKNSNDSKLNKNDHIIKNDIATADQSNNQIYNNTYYSDKSYLEIETNIT